MSDNSDNAHFSGVRFICSPYFAIKSADNGKIGAANESYALKCKLLLYQQTRAREARKTLN